MRNPARMGGKVSFSVSGDIKSEMAVEVESRALTQNEVEQIFFSSGRGQNIKTLLNQVPLVH